MNKAKKQSEIDGKKFLQDAFALEQSLLKSKLELSVGSVTHSGIQGDINEKYFIEVLRKYLPSRYAIDSAIVIDSNGATSDQIDIVIFDSLYTPTLLDQLHHRFVPAESVYAVFEAKPDIDKGNMEYAGAKAESVRCLHRTTNTIVNAGRSMEPRELFTILSGILALRVDWVDGLESVSFTKVLESLEGDSKVDCGFAVDGGEFNNFNDELHIQDGEASLGKFIFNLLGKLQSLGTVAAVDWDAYGDTLTEE